MTTPDAIEPSRDDIRLYLWVAVGVFVVVLAGYVWTLAPTVTFWDAGELIATSKILGIPHPPGTPLFVLIANVWGMIFPLGEFAFRTNFMTAVFSAAAAAFLFLIVAAALRGWVERSPAMDAAAHDRLFVVGGAAAAAVMSGFTFTVWQNSIETEVYMVATFSIAAICWLGWLWRKHRGDARAPHLLLVIVYLLAVSIGNHLLTLLAGPALFGYMWHVMRTEPLKDQTALRLERAQWLVLIGVWLLLIGTGLGKGMLIAGAIVFGLAALYASAAGAWLFSLAVLGIAIVGVSTYAFLYIRAGVGPFINEADPSTLQNLLSVIWREQYPPRSPIDNPIYTTRDVSVSTRIGAFLACLPRMVDGPVPEAQAAFGQVPECYTVRSIPLMLRQIHMYLQYFDWQFANGLGTSNPIFAPVRLPITILFASLGVYGAAVLRERDRSAFWLLMLLFLITGPGLVGYMNFKPGFSLGWDVYPDISMHEVRERDYFFTVSFQVWGLFGGIGLAGLYRLLRERARNVMMPAPVLALALVPLALNFSAATRRHGPDALLARDFAYDLLQSAEPYGIIFTNGDNDTFPLWYLQEVEGVRQDVSIVNLSLGNTDWYLRQLRDNPVRPFDREQAPWFANSAPETPPGPLHSMDDTQIASLRAQLLRNELRMTAGRVQITLASNTPLYIKDVLILRLLSENWNKRPIYFGLTAGSENWAPMTRYLTQEGLVFRVHAQREPDASRLVPGLFGVPMDVVRTDSLAWHVFRYARLFEADTLTLDPTSRNIAINLSYPFYALGNAYELLGDHERAVANLERGYHLQPIPEMRRLVERILDSAGRADSTLIFGDTIIGSPD